MNAADLLAAQRVVPVVVIDDADDAVPLAKTLL
jgi:2-keto-3-deoxy-6-phosphogluconate aldolase